METREEQIDRILKLSEDTNSIVRGMRQQHRLAVLWKVVYLGIFLWSSWWAYKQLLPYLDQLKATSAQITELNKTATDASATVNLEVQKLLEKAKK